MAGRHEHCLSAVLVILAAARLGRNTTTRHRNSGVLVAMLVLNSSPATSAAGVATETEPEHPARIDPSFGRRPPHFIENRGQLDGRVGFYLQGQTAAYFTGSGITYAFSRPSRPAAPRGPGTAPIQLAAMTPPSELPELPEPPAAKRWAVAIDLVGARRPLWPEGDDQTPTIVSYFKGPKEQWKVALPTYRTVVYRDVWPGIDLDYTVKSGQMKYTFVVQPGADPRAIKLRYRGAASVEVVDGELLVETPLGGFRDQKPLVYQDADGCREEVAARHTVRRDGADHVASFKLGPYDHALPLVIDPVVLVYCGYIGGDGEDGGYGIAVDAGGNAYVTGVTMSSEATFPVSVGPDLTYNGSLYDAFVAKVKADGTGLVYAGYIGGSFAEGGAGIAVDAAGNAYVTGGTGSDHSSFPVTVGPDLTFNGIVGQNDDAFVAKVRADGTGLVYAGYIGGSDYDSGSGIAVDSAGNAYVTGSTISDQGTFPVRLGPDLSFNGGGNDAFVAKVRADGTGLVYAGYLGGRGGGIGSIGDDIGVGIAVDAAGSAYVTGYTWAWDFPVVVGPDLTFNNLPLDGGADAFVAKVRPDGTGLVYSGFIGGNGGDEGYGIAVDASGNAYVAGDTGSSQGTFPVTVGPDLRSNGYYDAFVAKVRADGTGLVYAGYIGGADEDVGSDIAVDAAGNAYVTGFTLSSEVTFPVSAGPDLTYNGGGNMGDAFVAKVKADGTGLAYAGYIGGSSDDAGWSIAVDAAGDAYVIGDTTSSETTFPVTVGPDLTHDGGGFSGDAFVAKVALTSCLLGNLIPPSPLLGVKTADVIGARFEWSQDPNASEYHLNTVTEKTNLRETDPTSPRQMPVGQGETQCTALAPTVTCTDSDAIVDPQTLLFYQALSACGPTGADEGPVCAAATPCP
jgi:hypothetical protein